MGLFTSNRGYHHRNMRSVLVLPLLACAVLGAPQYGVAVTEQPQPAKIIEAVQEGNTHYEKECKLESQRLCQDTTRQECKTVQDQVCETRYQKVCVDEYKTVLEPYTETECVTLYKEDCEYHWEVVGTEKVWAVNPATCKQNPYDECHDVEKTHSKQVSYQVCEDVPAQKCHYVDRKECYLVPDQVCKSQPITKCSEVPKQICH